MKEYVANTGGRKLFNEDVLALQDLAKSFESFYADAEPFIVSGVQLTNTSGNLYDVSSGYVWLDGRIRFVAGANDVDLGTAKYINISDTSENTVYNDLISRESSIDYGTVISSSFIGADQSLPLSLSSKRYIKDILGADLLVKSPNTVNQTVNNELILTGQLTAQGAIRSSNGIQVTSGGLSVSGGAGISGGLTVSSGVTNLAAGVLVQGGLTVSSGDLTVTGTGVFNNNLVVSGLATFNGGMNVSSITASSLTVSKSNNRSSIIFPATTNDTGFIDHTEISNSATMRFSAGDDFSVSDKFEFGYGTQINWNPRLTMYATGRLDVNGVEVIDSSSRISWTRLKNNVSVSAGSGLTGGGSLTTNRTLSIANGGVVNSMYANSSITGSKVAGSTITSFNLADGSVGNSELQSFSVTSNKLASNSVDTSKILNGAVTGAKIASSTITSAQLASDSVGTSELQSNSVTLTKMQDMSAGRFMGRRTVSGSGDPQHLTASQMRDELGLGIRIVASARLTFNDFDYSSFSNNSGGVITSIGQIAFDNGERGAVVVNHNLGTSNYFVMASVEAVPISGTNSQEAQRAVQESVRYAIWDKSSNSFKLVIREEASEDQQTHYVWIMIIRY